MSGGKGDDTQYGGSRGDVIFANLGADKSFGGNGNDVLWALAKGDVSQPGVDALDGGNGNDRFRVRDGEADLITCGAGFDRVRADQFDVITDLSVGDPTGSCEVVERKDASTESQSAENRVQSPKEDRAQK